MTTELLGGIVEALLFASSQPLSIERLTRITERDRTEVEAAIADLNAHYEATGRAFRIHRIASGFQLFTTAAYARWVHLLFAHDHRGRRLSRASLETLAIIAYKQPVAKPEIDAGRGVDTSGPLMTLLERSLIQTLGRAPRAGHPLLYGTSKEFLRYFGLNALTDLPRKEELEEWLRARDERAVRGDEAGAGPAPDDPTVAPPEPPVSDRDEPEPPPSLSPDPGTD